jgi:class 3 adenylate cyclase/tetratricopeptide (TPR) repeat protein
MKCTACQETSPDGKPFCANCGTPLSQSCATCSSPIIPGKNFCADCGSPVQSVPTRPEPARTPVAERRLCSILFVDLVGFTSLSEERDPEAIRELLTRYFDRAQDIVSRYGGTIEKFIGDAVMAVWGAPIANEDDAERAVRAGLELVAAVDDLGREAGVENLLARAGVVTGEAAITIGKVSEGMVLGDTVNSAARIQAAAEPGTVYVDDATYRASNGAIAFIEIGSLSVKGKENQIQTWQATRVVGRRKGLGRSERLEPPFAGRDDDLRMIKDLLHATAREQRVRLVSVIGLPGIGKSRLAWEFLKYIDGLAEDVYWHQGRSASYGEGVTFGALAEMVRTRAEINEGDDRLIAVTKLHACVEEYGADPDECQWLEPRLGQLLGIVELENVTRDELFSAWRTFFERISQRGLTLLVFEDIQWADPGLLDFIESILEWSRNFPIMVVTLSRPELRDRRPDWGSGLRNFSSLYLDPLTEPEMRTMIGGFVEGLPEQVTTSVLARAEGIPLYAVETVRMFVGKGFLVEVEGKYRVDGDISTLEIPESLHALIASRLDSLPGEQRALLQDAAIVGISFAPETLVGTIAAERSNLDLQLRDLVRKEFLRYEADPRSPEFGQYGFIQGVIAEVALSMLSRRDRSAKHLAAARYFENSDDEEMAIVVAAHYSSAYEATPENERTSEGAQQAGEWLKKAGDRAALLGSVVQALEFYVQSLEKLPPSETRRKLLRTTADIARKAQQDSLAWDLVHEGIELSNEVGDLVEVAMLQAHRLGLQSTWKNSAELTVEEATEALSQMGADFDATARTEILSALAGAGLALARYETLSKCSDEILAIGERVRSDKIFLLGLRYRATFLANTGRPREAVLLSREVLTLGEATDDLEQVCSGHFMLSMTNTTNDLHDAFLHGLEATSHARKLGMRPTERMSLLNTTEYAIALGLWEVARQQIEELRELGLDEDTLTTLNLMSAEIAALSGDATESRKLLESDVVVPGHVHMQTWQLFTRAITHYGLGDFDAALAAASTSLALDPTGFNASTAAAIKARTAIWLKSREVANSSLVVLSEFPGDYIFNVHEEIRAGLMALDGEISSAEELYRTAAATWRRLHCRLDLGLTLLEMMHLCGRSEATSELYDEAASIFSELGATELAGRLQQCLFR